MARDLAECGSPAAYRRHLRRREPVDEACAAAKRRQDREMRAKRNGRATPLSRVVALKDEAPQDLPLVGDAPLEADSDHISRVEVLKEMLQDSRETVVALKRSDPSRVYLVLKEQREILSEIAQLQGNGQVKGVSLADQLAAARTARTERAAGA